jgi:penicillin-binding protein-related factor A (putative recombinase)
MGLKPVCWSHPVQFLIFRSRTQQMKFYLHFEEAPSFTYIIKNASDSLTIAQVKSVSRCRVTS